jgi:arabinofuranosyltransferase
MAWLAFSCFYYGFPFPNTAYAKLNTGIAFHESVVQGALYVLDSLTYDSLTLLVILTSLIIAWAAYGWQKRAIALGAGLYILYIVRIGGDFMSGRFFTAPLLCAVVLITRYDFEKVTPLRYAIVLISIVVLGLSIPYPTLVSGTVDYETLPARLFLRETGISDEAMFYARDLGLLRYHRDEPMPSHPWREQGEQLRASEEVVVVRNKSIGLYGYYVGPEVHIIDRLALTDPLLARLPARRTVDWRPGHFERVIPAGYIESLQFRRNEIEDPNLARYYDKLTTITQGPLWSPQRWLEIVRINFGAYDELIEPDLYRYPEMVEVTLQEPPSYQPAGTATNAPDNFVLTPSGLDLDLGSMVYAPYIGLSLDHDDAYKLVYFQGERRIAHHIISASHFPWEGLAVYQAEVPKRAQRRGYDRLYILPERGEPPYAVGHVNFHDPVRWITCSQQARCEVKLSDPDVQWLLKRGWASWEDWGRWNLGPQSSLTLYAAAQQAYELQIEAFPLEVDGTCDQSLRLWWNDTYVGERTFDGCEAQMLTFDIDASKVKRENDVLLGYERIYTPDDVGVPLPGETRPLSVGFIAFHLQPK